MKIRLNQKAFEAGCGLSVAELAGLALTAAGTGASVVARNKEQGAMNAAVNSSIQRQNEFQKQGQNLLNDRIEGAGPITSKQQIQQGTDSAMGEFGKLNQIPVAANSAASPTASSAITGGTTGARVGLFNQAAAPILGMEDWQTKQAIDDLKTRTALNQNNQFSQQVGNLLPYQLQSASQSQSGLDSIGSLLGTVGGLAGEWGATNPLAKSSAASASGFEGAMPGTTLPAWMKKLSAPSLIPSMT